MKAWRFLHTLAVIIRNVAEIKRFRLVRWVMNHFVDATSLVVLQFSGKKLEEVQGCGIEHALQAGLFN